MACKQRVVLYLELFCCQSEFFSPLKNINTLEKYQRNYSQVFWSDGGSALFPGSSPITRLQKPGLRLPRGLVERRCFSAPCWSTWRKSGRMITRTQVSIDEVARSIRVGRKPSWLKLKHLQQVLSTLRMMRKGVWKPTEKSCLLHLSWFQNTPR